MNIKFSLINKIIIQLIKMNYSTSPGWSTKSTIVQKIISNRIKRQVKVREIIISKAKPTVGNIRLALENDIPIDIINEEILNICKNLFINPVTLCLPKPHTDHVKTFTKVAGPNYDNSRVKTFGCYLLHSNFNDDTYVGQSSILGRRVRRHAIAKESNTATIIHNFGINGIVTLFLCNNVDIPIPINYFLTILEQYLFFILRPSKNKFLIASSGFFNEIKDVTNHIKAVGKPLYVYCYFNNSYYHLYTFTHITEISKLLNKKIGWANDVVIRQGLYKGAMFLSKNWISNCYSNSLTENQIKDFVIWLDKEHISQKQPVIVKDISNNEITYYSSKRKVRDFIKVEHSKMIKAIENASLINNRYLIKNISKQSYLKTKLPCYIKLISN